MVPSGFATIPDVCHCVRQCILFVHQSLSARGLGSLGFDKIRPSTVKFDKTRPSTVGFDKIRPSTVEFDKIRPSTVGFDPPLCKC